MSIQTELTRITNAKTAIKTAIEGKGVTVPDGTMLDGMASLIESIEIGGGSKDLSVYVTTYTSASDQTGETVIEIGEAPPISDISFFAIQNQKVSSTSLRGLLCIGQSEEFSGISGGLVSWYRYASSTYAKKFFSDTMPNASTKIYIEDGLLKLKISSFGILAGDTISIIFGGYV